MPPGWVSLALLARPDADAPWAGMGHPIGAMPGRGREGMFQGSIMGQGQTAALRLRPVGTWQRLRRRLRYLGPGFLVTAGFIDPGNWAANLSAGTRHGYALLWVVAAASLLLAVVQHASARLGIGSGLCLAEAASRYLPRPQSRVLLWSALLATVATLYAELLGVGIGVRMMTGLPLQVGATLAALVVGGALLGSGYLRLERWLVALVSLVGVAFLYEVWVAPVDWRAAAAGTLLPSLPEGSALLIASIVGAVVMPHAVFLHSEAIQSRAWHVGSAEERRARLALETFDTGLGVGVGWLINSAMVVAVAAFFATRGPLEALEDAHAALAPTFGRAAAAVFALALCIAGLAAGITAALAGGSISSGLLGHRFTRADTAGRWGVAGVIVGALALALLPLEPLPALLASQAVLSLQLPLTLGALLWLTASRRVVGEQRQPAWQRTLLWAAAALVLVLDGAVLWQAVA